MAGGSTKVIIISLCANASIAVAKFVGAGITGSASLMAEAVHSVSDCANQGLLLWGQRAAKKPPSQAHPLGYGREAFFWSFIVAILLFSGGGLYSIYEGWHKLHAGGELTSPIIGIGILFFAACLESVAFIACLKEVRATSQHRNLWEWIKHTTKADLLVIFLEDFAALLGLTIALIALLLSWFTGDALYDAIGSLTIGTLLIATAWVLAYEVKSLLIGERASKDYQSDVEATLQTIIPGAKLINFITLQQGISSIMAAYKIRLPHDKMMADQAAKLIHQLEDEVEKNHPEIKWQFAELDVMTH